MYIYTVTDTDATGYLLVHSVAVWCHATQTARTHWCACLAVFLTRLHNVVQSCREVCGQYRGFRKAATKLLVPLRDAVVQAGLSDAALPAVALIRLCVAILHGRFA